jgi:hypothetical protein
LRGVTNLGNGVSQTKNLPLEGLKRKPLQGKIYRLIERGYKSGKWSESDKEFTFRRLEVKTTAR